MKKIEKGQHFLKNNLNLFQCPVCQSAFEDVHDFQLSCVNNHQFDLSKKGTLYFLSKAVKTDYTRDMLLSRQRIAQSGFWHPLLKELYTLLEEPEGTFLDVGCGEGSHSHCLKKLGLSGPGVAFDISKEGINLAAATYEELFFLVGDLAQSPFSKDSFDTILNILSPSNYKEFKRILKPNGQVLKVVPGKNYLKELRDFLPKDKQTYSNEQVVKNFEQTFSAFNQTPIRYTVELEDKQIEDFINMTPLGWTITNKKEAINHLKTITVDLVILNGKGVK